MNPKIRRFMTRYCDQLQRLQFWLLMVATMLIVAGGTAWLLSGQHERSLEQFAKEARTDRMQAVAEAKAESAERVASANARAEQFAELAYRRMDSATDDLGRIATRVSRTSSAANTAATTAKVAATTAKEVVRKVDEVLPPPAPAAPARAPEWLN